MYKPHYIYTFSSWWTFELFLLLAIMSNGAINSCVLDLEWMCFQFSWVLTRSEVAWSHSNIMYNISEGSPRRWYRKTWTHFLPQTHLIWTYILSNTPWRQLRAISIASAQQMIEGPHSEGWNRGRHGNRNPNPSATTCNRERYHWGSCMYLRTTGDGEKMEFKVN